ncbi:uncharacterized protein LOC129574965 isoform X2 [Sitodiplosis mosellana]|uniref:uncharacterized protein LOC129574965 isoform X2 n=1 Tax=Sitodiplosis mosellana TaxID=263140 RepID=UPI002444D0D2|nr:uncharacterized protein LOC129574965 isoform X2 [Sitodiplosis mosellana]
MNMNDDRWTANELRTWFFGYAKYADEKYKENQLLISKMILVLTKMVSVLDRSCISEYPLLQGHRSGINPNWVNSLLIPQRADMQIAFELEEYFRRRNDCARHPGLTEEDTISENSFSVKFAMQDSGMKKVRKRILKMNEYNIENKRLELEQGRARVENLRERANQLEHHYFTNRWGNYRHSNSNYCTKCNLKLQSDRVKMREYEHLLPEEEFKQFAIVFEFNIPNKIACLRDVLYGLTKFCSKSNINARELTINWAARSELSEFNKSHCQNEYVSLGSTWKQHLSEHHLRKLYAMIETEALSFEKESVLMLIMQTLWECGVSGDGKFIRESHVDFNDAEFCTTMIELLTKFIEQQKDNWVHPLKLVMATLIAIRAFEINDHDLLADEYVELLAHIRRIALDWIDKIEKTISDMHNVDEKNERDLRLKLIFVAIAGSLTFFVHPTHKFYEGILRDNENGLSAAQLWLQFIISLKNNIHLYENNEDKLPSNLRLFLRMIETNGVYLEPKIKAIIHAGDVEKLIKKQWMRADTAKFMRAYFSTEYPQILAAEYIVDYGSQMHVSQTITIDIITGAFSVEGLPVSRLPTDTIQNELYQWFFGQTTFPVQPDAENSFSTLQKHNDCSYNFRKNENDTIITERTDEGLEKELLPHYIFRDDFPNSLALNYSHWWNKKENCIEFRVRTFGQKHFSKETTIDYRLDLATNRLIHIKTSRPMVDVKSGSYCRIVNQLSRLEHFNYIHVLMNSPKEAVVELMRMNLKFKIHYSKVPRKQYDLISNEFIGMRIARAQKIGTLCGLNHGLILESISIDSNSNTKILLIPHGNVRIETNNLDVTVNIDIGPSLRKPHFYQYQVDEFCQQLKSNNSSHASWFYLAYLHAITSHGEIEPFTGMSGTERALQILQSAFAWSSAPYEPEAIHILNEIAKLSPIRKLVDNRQIIEWPNNIPRSSAQDSFIFIVKKLLENSQRLHGLYFKDAAQTFNSKMDLKLNEREYRRCLQLNPNLCVSDAFIKQKTLTTSLPTLIKTSFCTNTQTVSTLYHSRKYVVPANPNLSTFLTGKCKVLNGLANREHVTCLLIHSKYDPVSDWWISIYDAVRNEELSQTQLTLILTLFTHQKEKYEPILALQAVAMNPSAFEDLNPPPVEQYELSAGTYDAGKVSNLLRSKCDINHHMKLRKIIETFENTEMESETLAEELIERLTEKVTKCWPCDSVVLSKSWNRGQHVFEFEFEGANEAINRLLVIWNNNRKLEIFIKNVEERLKSLPTLNHKLPYYTPFLKDVSQNWGKFEMDFDRVVQPNLSTFEAIINEAQHSWEMKKESSRSANQWWYVIDNVFNSKKTQHLIEAGIFPRLVPTFLLPKIIGTETDHRLKALIGAWAIAIAREQREKRIQIYSQRPELKGLMNRERENKPHSNWKPCDRPEWLIFEIEQNLTIRPIQIEIANRMIEPPKKEGVNAKHSVMQLNMGEGKTAVIVPISAAVLADGTQACQITVLKSLFATNLKALRQYLGGMLNRRIYTFPCRRDMKIEQHVEALLNIYEECKREKGVILTLPEYRLSFQLKIYESIQKGHINVAKSFMDVHKWINTNVRNLLDESDAILQPKYQLIYTVGNQLSPDGGFERWFVTQAILKRVPFHMKKLYKKYGKSKIEFDEQYIEKGHVFGAPKVNYRSDVFMPCRILDETIFDDLKARLVEDFLKGELQVAFSVDPSMKSDLEDVLKQKEIDKKSLLMIGNFPLKERNTIMILSGLLRFEVLKLVLTKRWRVNYGVDKTQKGKRKMAIPFKAKDVAAEMTEFGHPDAAICFTQLSYYYSGLDDDQLYQVFEVLESEQGSSVIYEKWIQSIPSELRDSSIVSYTGVNLDDTNQRERLLFPLLRFNMHVIDFWLSNVVFQHEAKTFEQKLMCSAWDLCSDQFDHCVTGFSGTNDTQHILPLPIAQNDLKKLENTNEIMREILLKPENRSYEALLPNVSGKKILDKLIEKRIPVLLDSGALMLELTNEQVAVEWLSKAEPNYEASVYFDSNDILQTIDRKGIKTEFDCSVYRENLKRCLVYLDDAHTRGTDLKFPPEWKACVTLSGDMTRDKTVQSCMRMRQLGKGQSISFWASYEADVRIRETSRLSSKDCVTNEHVIKFICRNSEQFVITNMVHWTASSVNYTKKLIGHKLFENTNDKESMEKLYELVCDDEFAKLSEMYGDKKESMLTEVAWAKYDKLATKHKRNRPILSVVRDMQTNVDDKLNKLAPNVKQFSNALDEEQEKELEQEIEEQRSVERPPRQLPANPNYNPKLRDLILNGVTGIIDDNMKSEYTLISVGASLSHTKLPHFCRNIKNAWGSHLFVTKDYQTVIGSPSKACDEFLRPVWWIAHIKNPFGKNISVLLSSHECDRLLPIFRKSSKSTLIMYRPRLSKLHSNLVHNKRLQVTKMIKNNTIDIQDEVQFEFYSGAMYFQSDDEQNAYCGFLGLIPCPRTPEQDSAFEEGVIEPKGFVKPRRRKYSEAISNCVGQCKFEENPVDLAIKIIEANHQVLLKESHVASIFERGVKVPIENGN